MADIYTSISTGVWKKSIDPQITPQEQAVLIGDDPEAASIIAADVYDRSQEDAEVGVISYLNSRLALATPDIGESVYNLLSATVILEGEDFYVTHIFTVDGSRRRVQI